MAGSHVVLSILAVFFVSSILFFQNWPNILENGFYSCISLFHFMIGVTSFNVSVITSITVFLRIHFDYYIWYLFLSPFFLELILIITFGITLAIFFIVFIHEKPSLLTGVFLLCVCFRLLFVAGRDHVTGESWIVFSDRVFVSLPVIFFPVCSLHSFLWFRFRWGFFVLLLKFAIGSLFGHRVVLLYILLFIGLCFSLLVGCLCGLGSCWWEGFKSWSLFSSLWRSFVSWHYFLI